MLRWEVWRNNWKRKKLPDGQSVGGAGRLTDGQIGLLQLGSGRNSGNVEEMRGAIWATFFHKRPLMRLLILSFVQEVRIPGTSIRRLKQEMKGKHAHTHILPVSVMGVIRPAFRDLAQMKPMARCKHIHTQSPNESFNNCIWGGGGGGQYPKKRIG
jgi:hypothetical protein